MYKHSGKSGYRKNVKAGLSMTGAANLIKGAYRTYKAYKSATGRVSRTSTGESIKTIKNQIGETCSYRQGKVLNEGRGGQMTETHLGTRKTCVPKNVQETLGPIADVYNSGGQLTSAAQTQAVSMIFRAVDNPAYNRAITGAVTRAICEEMVGEVTFANAKLSNCKLTIYDCISKRDVTSANYINPQLAWSQGPTVTQTIVGALPFDSDNFNCYWKVFKRTEIVLGSGVIHRHRVDFKPNALVAGPIGSIYTGWRDLTYACMVVISGQPENDTVTQTYWGLGSAAVNYTYQVNHKWRELQLAFETGSVSDNIGARTFAIAEQVVNEGTTIEPNALG